jgi:hypothetical protein
VENNKVEQVHIKLGNSITDIGQNSTIKQQLTKSVMDHQLYVLTEPIQVSYEIDEGKSIIFPAGRYLYIATDALHVTGVRTSPQLIGLGIDEAFELAQQVGSLLQSAGLTENLVKRTLRAEAKLYLNNLDSGLPIRVELFQYSLDQTLFKLEVARINAKDYAITIRISNRENSRYWMNAAEHIKQIDRSDQPLGRKVDIDAYLDKLNENKYIKKNNGP